MLNTTVQGFKKSTGDRVFWSILLAGLAIRLVILTQTGSLGLKIGDERDYFRLAENILAGNGFAWGPGVPTSMRPPLYPGFLAVVWSVSRIFDAAPFQLVRFLQIVLAAATAFSVYQIGVRVYNVRVARLATVAYWFYPSLMFFNFLILTETLFTFFLIAFVLFAVMTVQRPSAATAAACGLALGLGALTRSALWPVPALACPLLFFLLHGSLKTRLALPVTVLVGYAAVVVPWAIRNTHVQGVVTIVDTMGGMNLRLGNYEHTPDDRMWDAIAITGPKGWAYELKMERPDDVLTEGQKDKWAQRKAFEYMVAHPAQTLRRSAIKFADLWGLEREYIAGIRKQIYRPPTWFTIVASVSIVLGYVFVVTTGAAGIWLARPAAREHLLLLLPIVVIMGVHVLAFGHSRYHLPLIPILTIYSAALVLACRELSWAQHRAMLVTAGATVCVLFMVWARQLLMVDARRLTGPFTHG
jgi:4-amino-4-deoxy-L-arabinose transferase-like glycosyltransferase